MALFSGANVIEPLGEPGEARAEIGPLRGIVLFDLLGVGRTGLNLFPNVVVLAMTGIPAHGP
jgi:hypothetical protein